MKSFKQFINEDEMGSFRRKPNLILAYQWKGIAEDIPTDISSHKMFTITGNTIKIKTLEGAMTVSLNDWIVVGIKDDMFPVKPDIFDKNYTKEKVK